MSDEKRANASAPKSDAAPKRPPPAPAPAKGEAKSAAADLDLAVEEIVRPELMKEGFVGQER
jgi:hypothetical protein